MPLLILRSHLFVNQGRMPRCVALAQILCGRPAIAMGYLGPRTTWWTHAALSVQGVQCSGLGLKRGLSEDLVIAPCDGAIHGPSTVRPGKRLAARRRGWFGFYEALDYTPRNPDSKARRPVCPCYGPCFFAQHQGAGLVVTSFVLGAPMVPTFHADSRVRATVAAAGRVPRFVPVILRVLPSPRASASRGGRAPRRFRLPHALPQHPSCERVAIVTKRVVAPLAGTAVTPSVTPDRDRAVSSFISVVPAACCGLRPISPCVARRNVTG